MPGFWPSKPTVWLKFDPKLGPNMNCNYSRESLKGAKQTFEGYHTFSIPCSNKVLRVQCMVGEILMVHTVFQHESDLKVSLKKLNFKFFIALCMFRSQQSKKLCFGTIYNNVTCTLNFPFKKRRQKKQQVGSEIYLT